MKRNFEIISYLELEKVKFYTIQEIRNGSNETDDFFIRFKNDPVYQEDLEIITYWILKIGQEFGSLERYFRPERKAQAIPIPPPSSKLRLFCYRINDQVVILGNGGIKTSQKIQKSPDAFPHFELMNTVAFVTQSKIQRREWVISGKTIIGDLKFFI